MTRKYTVRTSEDNAEAMNNISESQYEELIPNEDNSDDCEISLHDPHSHSHEHEPSPLNDYQCAFGCHFETQSTEEILKLEKARKKLLLAFAFCITFMTVELIGGYISHSIALMSDALHLLSDCGGLMISVISLWITQKKATNKLTFGYHRAEIIGALFSVFLIWTLTLWLVYEAIDRMFHPQNVDGKIMFAIACCGIVVNVAMSRILHQTQGHSHSHENVNNERNSDDSHTHNINVRSAFIHVLGDLLQSIGVLISAALIWYDSDKFRITDPICTLIFSVIVVFTTVHLMRDILSVLMESVPVNINCDEIQSELEQIIDVEQIHDLHIWNISLGKPALSVHLLIKSSTLDSERRIVTACSDAILRKAQQRLSETFKIHHSTIQIEWQKNDNSRLSCTEYCNVEHKEDNLLCIS